jgi:hypothetical protein
MAQVMVLPEGLLALGDLCGRGQQKKVAMVQDVLLVWSNVAASAFAHAASLKNCGADVPKIVPTP